MKATQREFAQTAYLPFKYQGKDYIYDRTSTFAVPGNASVTFNGGLAAYAFNPYQKANGKCADMNYYSLSNAATATSVTENCAFDFVATIETFPENSRDSFFVAGNLKVNDRLQLFSDIAYSRFDLTARIAPNPVPISIPLSSSLYSTYVLPYLSSTQAANVKAVSANYRALDFGTRDSRTVTDSTHIVLGAEGDWGQWSYNSAFTYARNAIDEQYVGGYFKDTEFRSLVSSGAVDPFVVAGQQTAATQQKISDSIYHGTIRTASTTMTGLDFRASGELFKLPAGGVSLGFGADMRKTDYKQTPSADASAGMIYNYAAVPAYDLSRDNTGAFAELLVPVIKGLELTGAVRYDAISAITSRTPAGVSSKIGKDMDASTYKLAARFQATPQLLFRGSFGSGFKAPSMLDIAQPLVANGVTAASYDCPFPGTDYCKPGKLQYSQMSGGNVNLKPERSDQQTFGLVFEPNNQFAASVDYWEVKIKDAVSAVSANQAFGDPTKYSSLFMKYRTPAETQDYWAYINSSTNIGRSEASGIDWDFTSRFQTGIGRVTAGLAGTYIIKSRYTLPGTDNEFTDSLGKYGVNAAVTFRNILKATAQLDHGNFQHVLTAKYRSGYKDHNPSVRDVAANTLVKVSLDVPEYTVFDWQTTYNASKALELRGGVKNLFNRLPPLTLRESSGHQVGYDPRYADLMLRTVYLQASYKF